MGINCIGMNGHNQELFNEYICGRSIAVVGPAAYVTMFNHEDYIESFDIIMRFNDVLPIHEDMVKHIGSRVDILCNGLDGKPHSCGIYKVDLWIDNNVKWVFCPYAAQLPFQKLCVKNFLNHNNQRINTFISPLADCKLICDAMETRPNTGLLGLMYLLNNAAKEIFLTGFSFGVGGYSHHKGYKSKYNVTGPSRLHNQPMQHAYMKEIYKNHRHVIKVDNHLHGILTS